MIAWLRRWFPDRHPLDASTSLRLVDTGGTVLTAVWCANAAHCVAEEQAAALRAENARLTAEIAHLKARHVGE